MISCSAIKIETGQTRPEAVESAKVQASQIRADWANRLQQTTPLELARLLLRHVDSVGARFVAFGFEVAAQWREGNAGRGVNVPDTEMRRVVSDWTEAQQPILEAWEDNLEYGLRQVKQSGHFGREFLDLLGELTDHYYKVYSVVFYPSGHADKYERSLNEVQHELESVSARCWQELDRY